MAAGGRREGAGRKKGALTVRTRQIADEAIATGQAPLEVMLANMRHFHKLAESAEAALAELSLETVEKLEPKEQFKHLLAEVKKAAGLREQSQACARDAAPYMHAKMPTAMTHSGPDGESPIEHKIEVRFVRAQD